MTFEAASARLAGLAGAVLGWPPETFWTATPAELATIFTALCSAPDMAGSAELARLKEMYPDG